MSNWKFKKSLGLAACSVVALSAQTAVAGWSSTESSIAGMQTWVYTPNQAATTPRPLMVVLHGCTQDNDELKDYGNLEAAAEAHNAVIAVPYRPEAWSEFTSGECWSYDDGNSAQTISHSNSVINLAETLTADASLNIDDKSVYLAGISSGGGLTLVTACRAPEVFAGVSGIAAPSLGSSQNDSLNTPPFETTKNKMVSMCNNFTTGNDAIDTQIAQITWGRMDKDGSNAQYNFVAYGNNPAGETALVSVDWSKINVAAYEEIYGTASSTQETTVYDYGTAETDEANFYDADGNLRLSYRAIMEVGHAWPAGGEPRLQQGDGGTWVDQKDMDYPLYILDWFEANNMRKIRNQAPEITIDELLSTDTSAGLACTVTDPDGDNIASIEFVLIQGDVFIDTKIATNGCEVNFTGLGDGYYKILVAASDDGEPVASGTETSDAIKVGNPVDFPPSLTVVGTAQGQDLSVTADVSDDRSIESLTAELVQGASVVDTETVAGPLANGSYSVEFAGVAEGDYVIRVTATDNAETPQSTVAVTETLTSVDLGSTGDVTFHINAGHIDYATGYSSCYLAYGTEPFTLLEESQGNNQCQWRDVAGTACNGPVQECSGTVVVDTDKDGVIDDNDRCPNTPLGTQVDAEGCPIDDPDSDNDGVVDSIDQCPNTPLGTPVDAVGCPETGNPQCDEATAANYYHKTAGRAYSEGSFFAPNYFAAGSGEAMSGSTWGMTTLHNFDGSSDWFVGACPNEQ